MNVGEPAGARMPVVKGFSRLTHDYIGPALPAPRDRLAVECHWPKWQGDAGRWEFRYGVCRPGEGASDRRSGVAFTLTPAFDLEVRFYDAGGAVRVRTAAGRLEAVTLEAAFEAIGVAYTARVAAHLTEATRKS